ncbi:MraY family glycosyltransferase [uncultured Sunxiuqinia sp.]|jgi:UDP-GlcNAc:undecaprenyl-phosphate/decaprenyl-phosphate GlcNAc-1-phosphate transferase|uniref:glycosyltransferase family 4 protein n=1 Tax=uncultured Sunxiuqinia sp. TaxID=1573825 RepID=UPI0030D93F3E|tara:strand:+ start:31368 stop:32537 length:1170 start_codon:yes stop_codon:yes gene_type:complete
MTEYLLIIFAAVVASFLFTYSTIPPIVRISNEKHLFDVPNSRKLNKTVVPTLGGVAIFIGICLGSTLFLGKLQFTELRYIFAALLMLFFIGLKDDILIISARKKLLVQMAAAAILVGLGGIQITSLSNLFYFNQISIWLSAPLSFMILLFIINAMNLIDGIDGLAAGISILVSGVLGTWFYVNGHFEYAILSLAMSGSLLAFLRFNLWGGDNKVFMGDTGSLILGGLLGILVIKFLSFNIVAPSFLKVQNAPAFALALFIVPVTDTLRVFIIRLYQKRSPFSPDMNHVHHLLIQSGMKHIQASAFLVLYTAFFASFTLATAAYLSSTVSFLLLLSMSFGAIGLMKRRTDQIKLKRDRQIRLTRKILSTGIALHEDPFRFTESKKKIYQN